MTTTLPQPPVFVFGITGKMDLDDALPEQQGAIRDAISAVINRLTVSKPEDEKWRTPQQRVPESPFDRYLQRVPLPRLGLSKEQRVLLCSMAPGADLLAAEAAEQQDIPVIGCLPFPHDVYSNLTTFNWEKHRIDRGQDLAEANERRQSDIQKWLRTRIADQFCVRLDEERRKGIDDETLSQQLAEHLPENLPSDKAEQDRLRFERRNRYRAAGEYIAVQSHVLLAVVPDDWDKGVTKPKPRVGEEVDDDAPDSPMLSPIAIDLYTGDPELGELDAGSAAILRVKCEGITPGLLTANPSFLWNSSGPVVLITYPHQWHQADYVAPVPAGTRVTGPPTWLDEISVEVRFPADSMFEQGWNSCIKMAASLKELQTAIARNTKQETDEKGPVQTIAKDSLIKDCPVVPTEIDPPQPLEQLFAATSTFDGPIRLGFLERLAAIVRIRATAAKKSRLDAASHKALLKHLFRLTVLAVFLFQLGNHWHKVHTKSRAPEVVSEAAEPQSGQDSSAAAEDTADDNEAGQPTLPTPNGNNSVDE
ncbi:MAG: hypothetical protein KDA89_23315, partial [Planctomycetaceae bacterium]|nr:hypothetical protein [Planctomycetaceae bacterium]